MMRKIVKIVLALSLCSFFEYSFSQNLNPSYPRVAIFHWGGAVPEYYAKYKLIMIGIQGGDTLATRIRAIAPNAIMIPTLDFNAGGEVPVLHDLWAHRHADRSYVDLYFPGQKYYDISEMCPTVSGIKFNQSLVAWLTSGRIDFNLYNGVASDGVWDYPHSAEQDIDIDRNDINDVSEHGEEWITEMLTIGIDSALNRLSRALPDNKLILINSGGFHSFGRSVTNGIVNENTDALYDATYMKSAYDDFTAQAPSPHVTIIAAVPSYYPFTPVPTRNDLTFGRFMLGFVLLNDGYLDLQPRESELHRYTYWLDEFGTDLGYPNGAATEIPSIPGVWVRFFTKGAMIYNGSGANVRVEGSLLAAQPGYQGPYYRLRGGQAPAFNNGGQFTGVDLFGTTASEIGNPGNIGYHGDAILLFKDPITEISDIIIDNVGGGTSSGSVSANMIGNWLFNQCDGAGAYYTPRCEDDPELYGYYVSNGSAGTSIAEYRPTIGVTGQYAVYEWHGFIGSTPSAVNEATINYTIVHRDGTDFVSVNQATQYGGWNYLGAFHFSAGNSGYVSLSNANGIVMADAIKFVYTANIGGDTDPPPKVTGLRAYQQ